MTIILLLEFEYLPYLKQDATASDTISISPDIIDLLLQSDWFYKIYMSTLCWTDQTLDQRMQDQIQGSEYARLRRYHKFTGHTYATQQTHA